MRALGSTLTAGVLVVAVSEALQLRAAGSVDITPAQARRTVIVVLGLPGKSPVYRSAQRWRVAKAMRERQRWGSSTVIFTGGDPARMGSSEAAQMADIARACGLPDDEIVLEESACSTWQNIVHTRPLVGDADVVVVISDALHVRRAQSYWRRQDPDIARHVVGAGEHRLFDHFWITVPSTWAEISRSIVSRLRDRWR